MQELVKIHLKYLPVYNLGVKWGEGNKNIIKESMLIFI